MTLQAVTTTSDKKNASPEKPTGKTSQVGAVRKEKYWGLLNAKGGRRGKWESDCFTDKTHQHTAMIFTGIAWTSFPFLPWTVFFLSFFSPGGGVGRVGEEMERDTVMIGTVMDAKSN